MTAGVQEQVRGVSDAGWLLATAVSYAVFHHVGSLPRGLGAAPSGTRWADWIDVLTPYAVLTPAALALYTAGAPRRTWAAFLVGAVAYAQGQGMHLAANSIGNVESSEVAHLWDEVVGHYLWYAGVAVVTATLASTMRRRPRPRAVSAYAAAAVAGLTWGTNAVGGGTVVFSLLVALALTGYGWRHRQELTFALVAGYVPAVVLLVGHLAAGQRLIR